MLRFIATLSLLSACGPANGQHLGNTQATYDNDSDPCKPNPALASLQIGKGEFEYNDIDAGGQIIELIHGPQGGYHIVIALQAWFVDASVQGVATMTGTIDGKNYATSMPYVDLRCNNGVDALQSWGHLLIYEAEFEWLHQQNTEIVVTLTDASGTVVTDTTTVTIIDPAME